MIYVTGDTHGHRNFYKLLEFSKMHPNLNKNDFVIIAGDFGAVWNERTLKQDLEPYEKLPFSVLFVDGNHENFDLLNSYPIEWWRGGKIHRIKPSIIHLLRGQVFGIEGKRIFTFGGANSRDKNKRIEHVSWWKEEVPNEEEFIEAKNNLQRYNNEVDYVIMHSTPAIALRRLYVESNWNSKYLQHNNQVSCALENILSQIKAKIYFSGHQHFDERFSIWGRRYRLLYREIVPLK